MRTRPPPLGTPVSSAQRPGWRGLQMPEVRAGLFSTRCSNTANRFLCVFLTERKQNRVCTPAALSPGADLGEQPCHQRPPHGMAGPHGWSEARSPGDFSSDQHIPHTCELYLLPCLGAKKTSPSSPQLPPYLGLQVSCVLSGENPEFST